MRYVYLLGLLATVACGGGSSGSSDSVETKEGSANKTDIISIALRSVDELPTCTSEIVNQLAYVSDEKTFYVCEDNEWSVIEVLARELGDNEWRDPVTGALWYIGGKNTKGGRKNGCSSPYRVPTNDELKEAAKRGLADDQDGIWLATGDDYLDGAVARYESDPAALHKIACIKE